MRTHVEFRSDAFPAQPGEDAEINPGRWGRALADYLRAELSARQLSGGEPYAEDWGWAVPLDNEDFPLWVGCGNYEEYPDGFLCFIEPSKPFVRKFLRKIDTKARVEQVAAALDAVLKSHPRVRDLKWWPETQAGT
jgi:hypothetical protein